MRRRVSGVYTVEAAFVMLISMAALFALSFLAFYLHDRQSLEAEMNRLVRRAAAEDWEPERLEQEFQQGKGCRLFYMRVQEAWAGAGEEKTEEAGEPPLADVIGKIKPVSKKLEVKISFPAPVFLRGWLEETKRIGWISREASAYRPQEFIRKTEVLKGVLE